MRNDCGRQNNGANCGARHSTPLWRDTLIHRLHSRVYYVPITIYGHLSFSINRVPYSHCNVPNHRFKSLNHNIYPHYPLSVLKCAYSLSYGYSSCITSVQSTLCIRIPIKMTICYNSDRYSISSQRGNSLRDTSIQVSLICKSTGPTWSHNTGSSDDSHPLAVPPAPS